MSSVQDPEQLRQSNGRKTVLTIEWAEDADKDWLHDLSRSLSKHISAIRQVENVRMQVIAPPTPHARKWSDPQIIDAIQKYASEHGRPPTGHDWEKSGPWPNKKTVVRKFGNWGNAMVAAGFERPKTRRGSNPLDDLFREQFLGIK